MTLVIVDVVEVEGGEIEVFGACFGNLAVGRGDIELRWPGEDGGVRGTGGAAIILEGGVEGEREEGVEVGEDVGRESMMWLLAAVVC